MSPLLQNILALSLVAICLAYVGWQGYRALLGKRSRIGSCCAKGCADPAKSSTGQVAFLPVDMLSRNRKR
jgi:hypothetical protein